MLEGSFDKENANDEVPKNNNARNQNIIRLQLKSELCPQLPWHPGRASYLNGDCFGHRVK